MALSPQKVKGDIRIEGEILVPNESAQRAVEIDASGKVKASAVTSTELGRLSGVTSNIQTQLTNNATAISDHLADTVDAHDASAISVVASGNLAATEVQAALDEHQGDIDGINTKVSDLVSLSGVAVNSVNLGTFTGAIIPDNQTIKQAFQSLETSIEGLPDPMEYKGLYNATTNSPSLSDGVGNNGDVYHVNVAGSRDFGNGSISFLIGDKVVYNGATSQYEKWDLTDAVSAVFGRTGAVTAQNGDYTASQITNVAAGGISSVTVQAAINELDSEKFNSADFNSSFDSQLATKSTDNLTEGSTNLYFSNERAQDAVGSILTDSSSIDFTYNDAGNTISAVVIPAGVDHDLLSNFVANEHIDHSSVSINTAANSGLAGGGDITASRSLVIDASNLVAEGAADNADFVVIYDNSATATKKMTRANFLAGINVGASAGDIFETSFSMANNVSTPANVTGLLFNPAVVRSAKILISVEIDATADLFESFEILAINKGSSFDYSITSVGDESQVSFSINSSGQVLYISGNSAGFVSGAIKFRAQTTSI